MAKVSVIVPVFNTGEVLRDTIDSILSQTYSDFELLLINDGSTDNTGEICDEYMSKDTRVKVIHVINGGVCRARNIGIDNAKGEYITFCDHDDTYEPDLLMTEMQCAINEQIDMIIVGAKHFNDETKKTITLSKTMFLSGEKEIRNSFNELLSSGMLGTIWNVLYKKVAICDVRFEEKFKKGHEDINFNMDVIRKVNTIKCIDKVLYNHIIRKSMSTSASIHKESLPAIKAINDKVAIYLEEDPIAIDNDPVAYMEFQGRFMRVYSLYCVLTGMKIHEFIGNISGLKYYPVKKKMSIRVNKNYMIYWLISKNKYTLLFWILKTFSMLFKRKTAIS